MDHATNAQTNRPEVANPESTNPEPVHSDPENDVSPRPIGATTQTLEAAEAPQNTMAPIPVEDFSSDGSEFESDVSDLTSLSSSVLEYEYENGRRYHSNRHVSFSSPVLIGHSMPNDEEEQDRLDLVWPLFFLTASDNETLLAVTSLIEFFSWLLLLKGELFKAPVKNPQKILDLGTGTGIWAIECAEQFPQAHIIGNDISAIQPSWVCPNLEFIVEDYEAEWLYKAESFDFIHARLLSGCVADWHQLFRRCYDALKPGTYFEVQESAVWAYSDDGTCPDDSPLIQYLSAIVSASRAIRKPYDVHTYLKDWLIEAGFEDVTQLTYFLPYSPWPKDPHLKELGKYQNVMVQQAVEAYGLRLCTQVLGWGVDVSKIFQAQVNRQLRDKSMHAYVKEIVVYGRKPFR
ncbi:uncharacterized protein N7482_002438 [Penicillium canariense]|uniref:S-adenosyl-L-methionine-dependent methyltransferase n=1 Tax=Penicillium canariense TaxID=189055 RepID=A0A9W9ILS4_9EURO|nr:uncharacterized protein N7482_002438 [Penicillium canariense]KAJ5176561.1 hypothetical protein N7482_002438 [Penicillium canariense]